MSTVSSWPCEAAVAGDAAIAPPSPGLSDVASDRHGTTLATDRQQSDLNAIVADGVCYNAMVGVGETYFSAFVLSLGVSGVACGLLTSLPMLVGAALQLASPWGVRRLGSYRAWVVTCAVVQAASLLLLVSAQAMSQGAAAVVFVASTLYWAGALGSMPAWNTWVETIVPEGVRSRFFARRARWTQIATLFGFLCGGTALEWGAARGLGEDVFLGMFVAAAACRFASARCLASQSEPRKHMASGERLRFCGLASAFARGSAGRLVAYLMAVQVAVYLSGPYFAPFMFRELHLSFVDYTCLVGVAFVAKAIASPLYGRLAARIGSRGLLAVGGAGIVPVAGLWLFSDNYLYLLAVQALAGATWAAYELAIALVFFDAVPRGSRTSVLAFYNFGNAAAQVFGAVLGGWALAYWGERYASYHWLFGLSTCGRFAALGLLWWAMRRAAPTRFAIVAAADVREIGIAATDAAAAAGHLPAARAA